MYLSKKFQIQSQININFSEEDHKILNLLYQPLIGVDSLGIYNTLYFLEKKNNLEFYYDHKFLLEILNFEWDYFEKCKEKLEAIGLIKTFQNNIKERIYIIFPPLNFLSFFQDPILNQFLLSTIGEKNYNYLEKLFLKKEKLNLVNFKNISKKFEDIYVFKKINIKKEIVNYKNNSDNLNNIFYNNFDFDLFIKNLSERFQKPFLFEWHNIEYIMKLSFVYGLNPEEMASVYQEFFRKNNEKEINLNNLRLFLKRKYLNQNYNIQLISSKNSKNEINEMILYLKNSDPYKIIRNFAKNNFFSSNLQDIVFRLIDQNNDIDKGVINALIMYVCKIKSRDNTSFLSYNYFQTILNSWLNQGINSAETAYNFLVEGISKKNKINKKNNKIRPKWLEDIKKESTM
jgi:replication initiation and membrane attachment protein